MLAVTRGVQRVDVKCGFDALSNGPSPPHRVISVRLERRARPDLLLLQHWWLPVHVPLWILAVTFIAFTSLYQYP